MTTTIGINGWGRIGRYLARLLQQDKDADLELGVINARAANKDLAHLFKYDSVHGVYPGEVGEWEEGIVIDGRRITVTRQAPGDWAWGERGADIVVESTGKLTERAACQAHHDCGAKKVIISAPGKNVDGTFVFGVNEQDYDPKRHHVVSAASCTTNCLAPVAKVLHENFGLERGFMTTIHAFTMDQRLQDGSHKDPRRARSAPMSQVPTTTGAARAVGLVLPELAGRLDGLAVRVPTADVSMVDLVVNTARPVTREAVNEAFKSAAGESMGYTELPLVSVDYVGDTHGGVVDGLLTNALGDHLLKVMAWYDNEAGFTNQLLRLTKHVAKTM